MSKVYLSALDFAKGDYNRAIAEANKVYRIARGIAVEEQSASHKALEDAFRRATVAIDETFDVTIELACGVCDRATAAADAALAAKGGVPK